MARSIRRDREGCIERGLLVNPSANRITFEEAAEKMISDGIPLPLSRAMDELKEMSDKIKVRENFAPAQIYHDSPHIMNYLIVFHDVSPHS